MYDRSLTSSDGSRAAVAPDDAGGRPSRRRHGLWWLLAAASLPWLVVAMVLAATLADR